MTMTNEPVLMIYKDEDGDFCAYERLPGGVGAAMWEARLSNLIARIQGAWVPREIRVADEKVRRRVRAMLPETWEINP